MMKFIIKPGILWWMICSFQLTIAAQDFEETIAFADKQFEHENYQSAVKEYQRALFFSKGRQLDYLYNQIANSFFANAQYEQANYFYQLSYNTAITDSIKYETLFSRAKCYLLLKKYNNALIELLNVPDSATSYFCGKKSFYQAITYFGMEDFKESEKHFTKLVDMDSLAIVEIQSLFSKKRNLHRPNPKTAQVLSRILPGAGQLYAGDVKNSINSLALTGGFVALGFYLVQDYTVFDAVLTSVPWFLRYYRGGHRKAFEIASKKRAKRRNKTYIRVLEIVKKAK